MELVYGHLISISERHVHTPLGPTWSWKRPQTSSQQLRGECPFIVDTAAPALMFGTFDLDAEVVGSVRSSCFLTLQPSRARGCQPQVSPRSAAPWRPAGAWKPAGSSPRVPASPRGPVRREGPSLRGAAERAGVRLLRDQGVVGAEFLGIKTPYTPSNIF